jgi:hypothetical protein
MNKFSLVIALAFSGLLGGCSYLQPPPTDPIPAKPKPPKPDFFDPADNVKAGVPRPGTWRLMGVDASSDPDSNEVVIVQSISMVKGTDGKERPVPGTTPEKVRLAGLILPPKGGPGRAEAVNTINRWTFGKTDLEIEDDGQYPTDLQGRRLVQIYFKGTGGETKDKRLNLNRMLVRSGYAVVDLHQASSIDHQKWFNDEQYARLRRDPNDPNPDVNKRRPAPLGLWKMGIILGQRHPVPSLKQAPAPVVNGKTGATAPIGGTVVTKTTKTTVKTAP